ncbi:SecDF P1 head subdomain-containing protein [Aquimarina litoralis]|uniref:SecDF P1 head subdomain-containing protein n=1 Tax=Aquimarina litoralis TaxID=584605 RepID=UPI001C575B44|nr:hypothetical protein [Aquimarina litoralis]MBW1294922.1 hypothetical protein [Aquimarina litoralis]
MKYSRLFVLILMVSSCDFGPQPDKTIEIIIEPEKQSLTNQSIDTIIKTLQGRLKKIVSQYEVVNLNGSKIQVTAATNYEAERFKQYILNQGKLDFYETFKMEELTNFLIEVNVLANKRKDTAINPLFDLIKSVGYEGEPILFAVEEKDTAQVKKYLSLKGAAYKLPMKKRYIEFLWGTKEKETGYFSLYAVKKTRQMQPALSGDVVINAFATYGGLNMPVIAMQMNEEGSKKWEELTGKAFQQRSNIAIVLNNEVYSAPGVSNGPIHGGQSEISGDFTAEEALDFAHILISGEIPKMKLLSFKVEEIK